MTYSGHVKNGVVVFDGATPLEEGTPVRVEPLEQPVATGRRGSAEAIMRHAGIWADQADEMDRSLDDLRRDKQAELNDNQEDASL